MTEKTFTTDWTSTKIPVWAELLGPLRDSELEILEIGSYEGRSAVAFLTLLPRANILCVDTFEDGRARTFDRNVAEFGRRAKRLNSKSFPGLLRLRAQKRMFDLIYIDGSHAREMVLLDSTLSWPMVRVGGIVIWDDYGSFRRDRAKSGRPQPAIDGFLLAHQDEFETLHCGDQMIVRKTVKGPYRPLGVRTVRGAMENFIRAATRRQPLARAATPTE